MTDTTFPSYTRRSKRMTATDVRLRTLRVKTLRIGFLVGAIAAVLALVGSVAFQAMQGQAQLNEAVIQGEKLVIESPRFVGRTKDGGKVIVTARTATRAMNDQTGKVSLDKPVLETGDGSTATATNGVWTQSEQSLTLNGDVVLKHFGGDRATSTSDLWTSVPAALTMNDNVVLSRQAGDKATANTAIWTSNPAQLTFSGNVNITRPSGASLVAGVAVWRNDIGALDVQNGVRISLPSGESATAQTARFSDRAGDLGLQGQVVVTFAQGQASSARADFNGTTGRLTGEGGVEVRSSLGIGTASRYAYETRTRRLNLNGDARVTLR